MKKIKTIVLAMAILVLAVCFMVIAGGNGYKPQGYTVGITSKLIVPSIHPGTTTNWVASTAYSEGAYLKA